jgi:protein-tyrosine phosphatase
LAAYLPPATAAANCLNRNSLIDIHCHILPEVDDGPKSWEIAEQMCHMAAQDGTTHIVATPHSNDRYHYDRQYLSQLLETLQGRIGAIPQLSLGCDFHLSFENMQSAMQSPETYCIGKTRYLLIEFSNFSIPQPIDDWIAQMREREIVPIVTHPERNPILQQTPERVLHWVKLGCAVQVTASVLTGAWGARAQHAAEWLFKKKVVHILSSDGHDLVRRPPVLSEARKALAKEFGEEFAHALVEKNPGAVVNNQPPPWIK